MKFRALREKRRFISGKSVIGIDPAKRRHQAAILDPDGLQIGNPFSFSHDVHGFTEKALFNPKNSFVKLRLLGSFVLFFISVFIP